MKLTFPHMGTMWISVQSLLEGLGHEVVVPPAITDRTVALGRKGAPETACLPLKLNLGNYIEAMEMGADTIIMGGGVGPCRFGYYAEIQRHVLEDLGHSFDMLILEPPKGQLSLAWKRFRPLLTRVSAIQAIQAFRMAWRKAGIADEIDDLALANRPREVAKGSVTRARKEAMRLLAGTKDPAQLACTRHQALDILRQVPVTDEEPVLSLSLVGEIYTLLEPFANHDMERRLGEMGVHVIRTATLSGWLRKQVLSLLRFDTQRADREIAKPYLPHFVGGHGLESIADTVRRSRLGCDGVIHILPFTCMPEIVAQSILPRVSRDCGVPVMTLVIDEHSADAGIITRLEAFVDMARFRKLKRQGTK